MADSGCRESAVPSPDLCCALNWTETCAPLVLCGHWVGWLINSGREDYPPSNPSSILLLQISLSLIVRESFATSMQHGAG